MKDHAYIFILLAVFFSLPERGHASVDTSSFGQNKDTLKCIILSFEEGQSRLNEYAVDNRQAVATLDSLLGKAAGEVNLFEWTIESYASPFENTTDARRLAAMRSESVKEFLQKRCLNIDRLKIKIPLMGEGWDEFRKLISADQNVPDKEDVLALIDYHSNDNAKRKELIKKLDRGTPYRYMTQEVLPKLKRSKVTINWRNPQGPEKMTEAVVAVTLDSCRMSDSGQVEIRESSKPAPVLFPKEKKEEIESKGGQTILAIKNNLLYDLALAPNIEVEIPIGKRWSFNTEYKCPWWTNGRNSICYQLLSGGVEARCWLGSRQKRNRLTGHFLGLYAEGGIYDFQFWDDKGYQGKYYAVSGLTYGYAVQLARHFSMEFSLGVGYLTTEYKKYVPYEEDIVKSIEGRYNFIGPTKLKVSLVWLLTKRR